MRRRVNGIIIVMILSVLLTGCRSVDYNNAKTAIENKDYERAFELLIDLEDYKDSKQILIDNIIVYVDSLVETDDFGQALYILYTYREVSDFSELYRQIVDEKTLYDTYLRAKECFKEDNIEKGFLLLDQLPSDYRNIRKMYDTYAQLQNTPFKGGHHNGVTGEVSQSIVFGCSYSTDEEVFQLHITKKIYWSDGTVHKEFNYYIDIEDIKDNTINYGVFTWTMNDGILTEVEKGHTHIYR